MGSQAGVSGLLLITEHWGLIEGDKPTAGGKAERQMPYNAALDCPEGGRQVQGISS